MYFGSKNQLPLSLIINNHCGSGHEKKNHIGIGWSLLQKTDGLELHAG